MSAFFPADRAAKRRALLDAVERVRPTVLAYAEEAESLATLAPAVARAMDEAGLFRLKLPAELGGAEADPCTQMEVIEAMTDLDPSAGWATMIGATGIGLPGAMMDDDAIEAVFAGGRVPRAAGVLGPTGRAVAVDGGYRLTGRWPFASGCRHAEWLQGGAAIERDGDGPPELRMFFFPTASATIHDNWQVAGLKGSGSNDISVDDLFVPKGFTWDFDDMLKGRARRGGPLFRLGMPAFTSDEHTSFALGLAKRALALLVEASRSEGGASMPVERPFFQRCVAQADLRLRGARLLAFEVQERAWQTACTGEQPGPELMAELRGAAVHCSDVAVDLAMEAFRFGGEAALHLESRLQQHMRDANAAAQHIGASDVAYEAHGQAILGVTPTGQGTQAPR